MSNRNSIKGKGKARIEVIDLTVDVPDSPTSSKAAQVRLPSPVTPPHGTRRAKSPNARSFVATSARANPSTPIRSGPSNAGLSSSFTPTQSTKRKAQQARITSFFPAKKLRIETLPPKPTKEEARAAKEAKRLAEEEDRIAKADARDLARELEREERALKRVEEEAAKAAKTEERRLKKEAREAEVARRRDLARWKADWKDWVQRHRQPDAQFEKPKNDDMWDTHVNIAGTKDTGLTRTDLDCLPHCDVKNPWQPAGEEWAPMKIYRKTDVEVLAWRKEGVVTGVPQDDEDALLDEGEKRYKARGEL